MRLLHRRRYHCESAALTTIDVLWSFNIAAFTSILAIYLHSFGLGQVGVGVITGTLTMLGLLTSVSSVSLLERFQKVPLLISTSLLVSCGYLIAALIPSLWVFCLVLIVIIIAETVFFNTLQILFKDVSSDASYARNIGVMYSLESLGWIVMPFVSGVIANHYGFQWVFLIAVLFPLFGMTQLRGFTQKKTGKTHNRHPFLNLRGNLKYFFKNRKVYLPYTFSASIGLFWHFLYIYPPLFLVSSGYSPFWVGIFIAAINIPPLLFEHLVGKHLHTVGHRRFFLIGFSALATIFLLCAFINNLALILVLLVLSTIPLSFVEPLQPTYFFSLIAASDEHRLFPIFDTAFDVGSTIGKFLPAAILAFLPASFTYVAVGGIMFLMGILSLYIRRT